MSTNTFGTSGLSVEELELLAYLLEEEGVDVLKQQTIFPRTQHERLPLSFAQTRLWFLDQFEPGTAAYNIPYAMRLSGRLAVGVLQQSLNATVRRHEILRTSFPTVDNQPIQAITRLEELPAVPLPLPVIDLRRLPEVACRAVTQRLANQAAQRSFDLARGPLISATLLRLAEDAHILLLTVHHIVFDGWSIGVFLQEMMALYDAFVEGGPSPLQELPIQYADFALWQRQWLQGEVLEQQLAYWKQQLGGTFPVLQLPTDRPRPPLQTHRGNHCSFRLPLGLSRALIAFSQREEATLFMTLLTAFNVLLHRYTGQDDIIVGSPIANRDFVEIERLIGFFVNTLLLRSDLSGDPPFRELLRRVREMTLEAYAHQNVPFEQLVDELRPERNLSHSPLFQVMFILQNAPLPPNGKLDRRALPAPSAAHPAPRPAVAAPRTPVEEALVGTWAQILRREQVGIHDNFFELGGHSLLATQVIAHIRAAFQVELSVRTFFEAPTIAGLAAQITAAERPTGAARGPLERRNARDAPLSFAQQRLWFLDQLQPNSAVYNIPLAVRMSGPLNQRALEHSLNAIVARHEALRTTFANIDGAPVQSIARLLELPLQTYDLQGLPPSERATEARRRASAEAQRPFDLSRGPLIRATLLQLDAAEHVLLLTMHHIISDGWSLGVLIHELTAHYIAAVMGSPAGLPALPIQYADYAVWQRAWLQGELLEQQLAYWRTQLAGLAPLGLPTDYPRPLRPTDQGATMTATLPIELTQQLQVLSRREGVTLFMTLLAAFQVLLARYSGQDDIAVGTPIANRTQAEIEGLLGCFVNTLVLRTDLSGNPTFRALLIRVRETTLEAYAHQEIPFEMVVEALQPERSLSHTPLFQVMLVLQNTPLGAIALPGLEIRPLDIETETAKLDLTLMLAETSGGLRAWAEYRTDLFTAPTIGRLLGHWERLLAAVVAAPDQRLSDLPLLTDEEQQLLLVDWNATTAPYPRDHCLHELFEAQVARTPDAIAVIDQRPTTNDQRPTTNDRQGDKQARGQGDSESETQNSTLKTQNFSSILHPPSSIHTT